MCEMRRLARLTRLETAGKGVDGREKAGETGMACVLGRVWRRCSVRTHYNFNWKRDFSEKPFIEI